MEEYSTLADHDSEPLHMWSWHRASKDLLCECGGCSVGVSLLYKGSRNYPIITREWKTHLAKLAWLSCSLTCPLLRVLAYYFIYISIYLCFWTSLALKVPYYCHFHIYIFICLTGLHSTFEMKWKTLLPLNLLNFFNWFLLVSCWQPSMLVSIWLVSILKRPHFLCVQQPEGWPLSSLRSWCTCPSSVFRSGFS